MPSEVGRRYRVAAYYAWAAFRYQEAEAYVARAITADERTGDPVGRARNLYYRGLADHSMGRSRRAVGSLREAARQAWALGEEQNQHSAEELLALALQETGHHREALELLDGRRAYVGAHAIPRDKARFEVNRTYARLRALASGAIDVSLDDVRRALRECARDVHPHLRPAAFANLAWAESIAGDVAATRKAIWAARDGASGERPIRADADRFLRVLEADLDLRTGALDAAESGYRAALSDALAAMDGPSETAWTVRFGLGRVAMKRTQPDVALRFFRAALADLEALGQATAVRRSRAPFFSDRRAVLESAIDLLVQLGRTGEAFALADGARSRVLRALDTRARLDTLDGAAREAWSRKLAAFDAARAKWTEAQKTGPMDQAARAKHRKRLSELQAARTAAFDAAIDFLDESAPSRAPVGVDGDSLASALPEGEAVLLLAPRRKGWTRFWVDRRGVRAAAFDEKADGIVADAKGLKHLHVVPGGWAGAAQLPSKLLDAGVSVGFVPHAGFLLRARRPSARNVVLADATFDLPSAREEGRAVAKALNATHLERRGATREAFLDALRDVRVLHFAGHGVLRLADPWETHLKLADGRSVGLADLLVAHGQADLVVLSGCRTGAPAVLAREDVVGLPEALLVAGARSVVAAGRDVPDEDTRRYMERFYAEGGATHPGRALRKTAAAFKAEGVPMWDAFRLVGLP